MPFDPTLDSVRAHQVPEWFHDAKLGIFVHWGLYSVPAWAPTKRPSHEAMTSDNGATWFRNNPYAEWYANSLRVSGSSAIEHHTRQYGAHFAYDDFVGQFNADTSSWNPDTWAELFREAGAGYVVLTTKHHNGFLLWPSATPNPTRPHLQARRDLVGDLTTAVRAQGLKMGLYYSVRMGDNLFASAWTCLGIGVHVESKMNPSTNRSPSRSIEVSLTVFRLLETRQPASSHSAFRRSLCASSVGVTPVALQH